MNKQNNKRLKAFDAEAPQTFKTLSIKGIGRH